MKATQKRELATQKKQKKAYEQIVKDHYKMQSKTTKEMMKASQKKNKKLKKPFKRTLF